MNPNRGPSSRLPSPSPRRGPDNDDDDYDVYRTNALRLRNTTPLVYFFSSSYFRFVIFHWRSACLFDSLCCSYDAPCAVCSFFFSFRKYSLNLSAAAPHPITGSEWVRHFCWEPGDKFGLCCCFLSHGFSATHSVTLFGAVLLWALHHCCRTANAPPSSPSPAPATPVHFNSIFLVFLVASVPRELTC